MAGEAETLAATASDVELEEVEDFDFVLTSFSNRKFTQLLFQSPDEELSS